MKTICPTMNICMILQRMGKRIREKVFAGRSSYDEEISTHDSTGDAMVNVLEGVGEFTVDGVKYEVKAGESLIMPAKSPIRSMRRRLLKCFLSWYFHTRTPDQGVRYLSYRAT